MARLAVVVTGLVLATGCGCANAATPPATQPGPAAAGPMQAQARPSPAAEPSQSARLVCQPEAEGDISQLLGVSPVGIDPPTWADSLYSCRYRYTNGSFTLSVKELPDRPAAAGYAHDLGARLGNVGVLDGIGEAAFATTSGSVVARKDDKVLLVDITGLPPTFGRWSLNHAAVAHTIASAVMDCWDGE